MKLLSAPKRDPFYQQLTALVFPIMIQSFMLALVSATDAAMLGIVNQESLSAVSLAGQVQFVLNLFVTGIAAGTGIIAAQYWGKGDDRSVSRALGVASLIGTAVTLPLAVVFALFPVPVMDLLSNKHELSLLGAHYLRFNMLSSLYVSAQRSAENPAFGMKLFGFSTILNTGLNYLLIFGHGGFPALGVAGAAIATLLSRVSEFLICAVCALRSRLIPLHLGLFFRPGLEMTRRFIKYASPVVLNETVWGLGNSLLTVILGYTENSVEMLAANAVMGNLNRLFLVVCFGLGAATAVMVGKAIGEGQSREKVMALSRTLLWFAVLVGSVLALFSLALVPVLFIPVIFPLFKLFGQSAEIATALAVMGFASIPLHACAISAITGVLRAGGDVLWSTALDIGPQWVVCLPAAALAALVWKLGCWPIAFAIQLESVVKFPLCLWRLRDGKWINDVTGGVRE